MDVQQKFTGQLRDTESGLDFFNARYYGYALNRFTSPDPANAGADLSNPQTWNGYAYVANNPVTNVDPSGAFASRGLDLAKIAYTNAYYSAGLGTYSAGSGDATTNNAPQRPPIGSPMQAAPPNISSAPAQNRAGNRSNCVSGFTAAGAGGVSGEEKLLKKLSNP